MRFCRAAAATDDFFDPSDDYRTIPIILHSGKDVLEICKRPDGRNIHGQTSIGRFERKIGRLSDDSITGVLQPVGGVPSASCPDQYLQINKPDQITVGGILDNI
jgi:hypothetical protein